MSVSARERAQAEQRLASDPAVSAFVAASAGSGKTKLLTDRLLRLMLTGAEPSRIQCLTFTKAAAAEMAVRLQRTLGKWVTLPDADLATALRDLDIAPSPAAMQAARALFARVLDLPGGMRIGTIHAFCQSLLRRFPLEASLSPHFQLVDDIEAGVALRAAREDMLGGAHTVERRAALRDLAGLASLDGFGALIDRLQLRRDRLALALADGPEALSARLRRLLGVADDDHDRDGLGAVAWPDEPAVRAALTVLAAQGSDKVRQRAKLRLDWLALAPRARLAAWPDWRDGFLRADGEACALSTLINDKLAGQRADLADVLRAEQQRVLRVEDQSRARRCAAISAALASLAAPVIDAYAARKSRSARLDYDDLIAASARLLVDPGAAWVLFKLDGGLDHLLLDEVQDTAPAQWDIAGALTAEFFAGEGAQGGGAQGGGAQGGGAPDRPRTVFAVGDRKQSIYSFQGADPDAFEHWRGVLRRRVRDASRQWRDVTLDVSFRSAAPVLALVDAVFAMPAARAGVVSPGETLRHFADRAGHAGLVELWPLAPAPEVAPPDPWTVPERNLGTRGAMQLLADRLAGWIARETGGGVMLDSRGRALAPGDVLVLVRRRNAFARALVRALKARGVPVAGLDRMVLTEQPAVADLLALCDTLLLPEDDLSLACVLTSPLGGLTDDSLLALAAGRTGRLWDALRARAGERAEWRAAQALIAALQTRVDYATPHALLAEALGPMGGRARLLARLGPEAAEPIDELLNAALAYARGHPPSLQGFLHWLRQSGAEVKREAEGAGGLVRIMTVHGAKGLQAPLVILPDTTSLPPDDGPLGWAADPADGVEVPVWVPRRELRCAASASLREAAAARRAEEHNRLLYVALTRAEDRLLVCGWQPRRDPPPECWYRLIESGFAALAAASQPFAAVPEPWPGEWRSLAAPQTRPPRTEAGRADLAVVALPAWAGSAPDWRAAPPPAEPPLPVPLAPSRPQDAAFGPVPNVASPLADRAPAAGFRRGQLAHALLQHLPALPQAARRRAALDWLARPGHGMSAAEARSLTDDVLAVLSHPELGELFGPLGRAETPLTGVVAGRVIGGLVDRLAVLPDRVLLADYKTNRAAPARVADVPVLYLRQMAAYRAVVQAIYPERDVRCMLIWTSGPAIMPLPPALLDRHAPDARQPA